MFDIQHCISKKKVRLHNVMKCIILKYITFRVIRLNSPNLNYIIVIGAVMLYMTVFFFTISSVNELVVTYSCHVSTITILIVE